MKKEHKAIEIVIEYEKQQGRNPINVSKTGCGYDIQSSDRLIEVKGVGESWKTYTWQSLYPSEVRCINKNPKNFYLYIVKFDKKNNDEFTLFVIPGKELKKQFKVKITAYALTPISKAKLRQFIRWGKEI